MAPATSPTPSSNLLAAHMPPSQMSSAPSTIPSLINEAPSSSAPGICFMPSQAFSPSHLAPSPTEPATSESPPASHSAPSPRYENGSGILPITFSPNQSNESVNQFPSQLEVGSAGG